MPQNICNFILKFNYILISIITYCNFILNGTDNTKSNTKMIKTSVLETCENVLNVG